MFRKPKRKVKQTLRRKESDEEEETRFAPSASASNNQEDEQDTSELVNEARKRTKTTGTSSALASASTAAGTSKSRNVMHAYDTTSTSAVSNKDLAVSTAQHHAPEKPSSNPTGVGADGIFRADKQNKFHAGPIRAAQHVRVTARFDYQPDICKDYKDTGFCGFGDTCIYLHDRGDTLSGWQLEQQWEEEQRKKKEKQERGLQDFVDQQAGDGQDRTPDPSSVVATDDGLPFACHLCRDYFKNPVVSNCGHYFCQDCILQHVRSGNDACPICNKDMQGVFNQPTKLISKKRRALGSKKAATEDSWKEFSKVFAGTSKNET